MKSEISVYNLRQNHLESIVRIAFFFPHKVECLVPLLLDHDKKQLLETYTFYFWMTPSKIYQIMKLSKDYCYFIVKTYLRSKIKNNTFFLQLQFYRDILIIPWWIFFSDTHYPMTSSYLYLVFHDPKAHLLNQVHNLQVEYETW